MATGCCDVPVLTYSAASTMVPLVDVRAVHHISTRVLKHRTIHMYRYHAMVRMNLICSIGVTLPVHARTDYLWSNCAPLPVPCVQHAKLYRCSAGTVQPLLGSTMVLRYTCTRVPRHRPWYSSTYIMQGVRHEKYDAHARPLHCAQVPYHGTWRE